MSDEHIKVERKGHILLIGINRPKKRNAFSVKMFQDLGVALGDLQKDDELRCGVVYAEGDHFTSGLDLPEWGASFGSGNMPELPEGALDPFGFDEAKRVMKPVVMAVQGMCYTIGQEFMLTTDIRVAAKDVRFAQLEIKRGIYPVGGGTVRLLHEIGWGNAMRYLLTGDEITGEAAYRLGLVQELVEPGEQLDKAIQIAEVICKQAPLAVYATLRSSRQARSKAENEAMQTLLPELLKLMVTEDVHEGLMSFVERREANFKGR
jgi:enoyl-CoA hydratase/carnithine racemase